MGTKKRRGSRRHYDAELKAEAVRMLLDGHSASSIASNLGIGSTGLIYRWKRDAVEESGVAAEALDARVRQLEAELRRTERERDILKKALAIFSQQM